MTTTIIQPGQTVIFDTREGGDTVVLINNSDEVASYSASIDGGEPQDGNLNPGVSLAIDIVGASTVAFTNTGDVPIEAQFS